MLSWIVNRAKLITKLHILHVVIERLEKKLKSKYSESGINGDEGSNFRCFESGLLCPVGHVVHYIKLSSGQGHKLEQKSSPCWLSKPLTLALFHSLYCTQEVMPFLSNHIALHKLKTAMLYFMT